MSIYRKWYCTCTGIPMEIGHQDEVEDEPGEPVCDKCGASPSVDPKQTITHRHVEDWED